jgi:multiple sugar transport system permease protein
MVVRGDAFLNTVIYIAICIILSLTINPLSAYALSRFKLKWGEQILLFLLATMAFPGAVTAIPSFLLLRDLQLLNTFYALFLPGLANGMSIFIMKCFFDGLPRELYEAATIDGATFGVVLPLLTEVISKSGGDDASANLGFQLFSGCSCHMTSFLCDYLVFGEAVRFFLSG